MSDPVKESLINVVKREFGDRRTQVVGDFADGSMGLILSRPVTAADMEGLTEEQIKKGVVNPNVYTRREGDLVLNNVRISREGAYNLMLTLEEKFKNGP